MTPVPQTSLPLRVSDIRFTQAPNGLQESGLLGWIACTINRVLVLDGLCLRRTADDRLTLSFPERLDRSGRRHHIIRPVDDRARREVEHQVLQALGLKGSRAP